MWSANRDANVARGNSTVGLEIDSEGHDPADSFVPGGGAAREASDLEGHSRLASPRVSAPQRDETQGDPLGALGRGFPPLTAGAGRPPEQTFGLTVWPELETFIGPGGKLEKALGGYERRAGQELMMRTVAHTLEHGDTLVIEAGTGIGKSLGYLLPAALSGQRVILSTGTRTLQDQLWQRQVPFLKDELGLELEATVLKGRTNYLCLLLLGTAQKNPDIRLDEHLDLHRILTWSETTKTGDRAELTDLPDASTAWRAVAADSEKCLGRSCPLFSECFLMAARRRAEAADLVIVNHHLFFADLQLREGARFSLLPDAHAVVFDEAHHLESVASNAFGRAVSDMRIKRLAIDARRAMTAAGASLTRVDATLGELDRDRERLWGHLVGYAGRGRFRPERLPPTFLESWYKLDNTLVALSLVLGAEAQAMGGVMTLAATESLRRLPDRIEELRGDLMILLSPDERNDEDVRWVERGERATFVRSVPVDVGPRLQQTLTGRFRSLVFTSATLRASSHRVNDRSGFEHFFRRLGLPAETRSMSLPSPFDYPNQALLYAPVDLPEPRHPAYGRALIDRIASLVAITKGRALVLFTSRERMVEAHAALAPTWAYPTLVQGQGSKESLLERFVASKGSVLFATATFWEGVDVVGEALSLVIIEKLPFAPPNDPIVDARLEHVARAGGDGFLDYQVPTAIVSLKQGFGRLIRHRSDRGIVAVLDSRLANSRYGRLFMESLPPARRVADLDELAIAWQGLVGVE